MAGPTASTSKLHATVDNFLYLSSLYLGALRTLVSYGENDAARSEAMAVLAFFPVPTFERFCYTVSSKDDLKTGDDWHEVQPRTPNGGRERDSPLRGLPPERRSPRAKKPPPKRFIDELEVEMAYSRKRRKLTHPPPLRADTEKVTLSKQVYEIEQVVGHDGDRLRVRWSGHGADGDTWEGPGNIDLFRAPVVQSYLKSHGLSMPKKKTSRTRASTVA